MTKYEHSGSYRVDTYRPKPEQNAGQWGWVIVVVIILLIGAAVS